MTNQYILCDEYAILRINSKKFGVTEYIIDKEDVAKLSKYKWAVAKRHHGVYAQVNTKLKPKEILLQIFNQRPPEGVLRRVKYVPKVFVPRRIFSSI